jgi:hypothetical protein
MEERGGEEGEERGEEECGVGVLCGVVFVVWCGVVWCGVVWCGAVVCSGVVWCVVVCSGGCGGGLRVQPGQLRSNLDGISTRWRNSEVGRSAVIYREMVICIYFKKVSRSFCFICLFESATISPLPACQHLSQR